MFLLLWSYSMLTRLLFRWLWIFLTIYKFLILFWTMQSFYSFIFLCMLALFSVFIQLLDSLSCSYFSSPFLWLYFSTFSYGLGIFRWIWNIINIGLFKVWPAWCKSQPGLKILLSILWSFELMLGHTWGKSSWTLPRRRSDAHGYCFINSIDSLISVDFVFMVN